MNPSQAASLARRTPNGESAMRRAPRVADWKVISFTDSETLLRRMTPDEPRSEIAKFPFWYHRIDLLLGHGVVTPGHDFEPIWDMIRDTRRFIDYRGKKVLDLASFDEMWAFEAERLGALVVAFDSYY